MKKIIWFISVLIVLDLYNLNTNVNEHDNCINCRWVTHHVSIHYALITTIKELGNINVRV